MLPRIERSCFSGGLLLWLGFDYAWEFLRIADRWSRRSCYFEFSSSAAQGTIKYFL